MIFNTLWITICVLLSKTVITLAQDCSFKFSAKGLEALQCMEGFVDGCYLDSQCYWTIWWGHLVGRSKSAATYDACRLLRAKDIPLITFQQDVESKVSYLNSGLKSNGPQFCKGGAKALTQGEYDAPLTATFQGAVLFKWFKLSKQEMKDKVTAVTKTYGGTKRLNLFNRLWTKLPLDCKPITMSLNEKKLVCLQCKVANITCQDASRPKPVSTKAPTKKATMMPTKAPTMMPTMMPTKAPTSAPITLAPITSAPATPEPTSAPVSPAPVSLAPESRAPVKT